MAFNIGVTSTFITESESYEWYTSTGVSLKNIKTYLFQTTPASAWVDISNYVKSIRINGSVNNLSGEPGANTAFIELDNLDKRFTDINAASPLVGNLNPNQQIYLNLSIGAESVTIFKGRVSQDGFVEDRVGHEGIVTLNVLDGSGNFMRKKFDKDYFYQDKKIADNADAANSLLNILLETHGGLQHSLIVANGAVDVTVPFSVFRKDESIQDQLREILAGCLVQYAGFRYDGKYTFQTRLVTGWSEPSSEYTLTAESHSDDITRSIVPLIGNNVKVRGVNDFVVNNAVLWELTKVKAIGTNSRFPDYCWETVNSGDFYLGTPTEPYRAEYQTTLGELLYVTSAVMSQRVMHGWPHTSTAPLVTVGTDLDVEPTAGDFVLQNSTLTDAFVMNIKVKGTGIIRHKLSHGESSSTKTYHKRTHPSDPGYTIFYTPPLTTNSDDGSDDSEWGIIGVQSNASSISQYGQTDMVVSSEYIVCKSQLDNILQWNLLNGKDPKHVFSVNNLPFLSFIQPGAPLWFNLTDLGFSGMVTVASFEHNITPDGADTSLTLIENPGDWLVSTGATIRTPIAAPSGGTGEGELGPRSWMGNTKYYVGALGCSLPVDIMCDGVGDHEEWNEAIATVYERGGGIVAGVGGTFVTSAPISMMAGVCLELDAGVTVEKNGNYNAIEALGTATTHMANIAVIGKGTVTRDAGDTNAKDLVYFDYAEDFDLQNIILDSSYSDGAYLQNCVNGRVGGGMKLFGCGGSGLKLVASRTIIAASLVAISCAIGCDMWPSIATDKISHGNCESTDEPMLDNETTPYIANATWARDASVANSGTYSYKLVTNGDGSVVALQDNLDTDDMHGTTAGKTYHMTAKLYIPSGGVSSDEVYIVASDYYSAGWHNIYSYAKPIYDTWQTIHVILESNSSATGIAFEIEVATTAALNEYLYVDDISVYEYDETDSGCQLVNSSIEECADGIIVANSHAIIQNNQITGCKSTGITIAAGYRNLVSNNRCFNNGSDTGLGNENQHNFYDAGIDTQLG